MNQSGDDATWAYGVLDAGTGQLITTDAILKTWLGEGSLSTLLPEIDLPSLAKFAEWRTSLCRAGEEPILAKVELRPLLGANSDWRLLRIHIAPDGHGEGEYRDAVTGLPDRRALEVQRGKWQRYSSTEQVSYALLFMDLDNFKQINDAYGHATGDKVLGILAERWQKSLRGCDLIVRYGGDEFVVLLAGIRTEQEAHPVMQRLRNAAARPLVLDGHTLAVSATIGFALADDATTSLEELLISADQAMYAAKRMAQE